MGVELRELAEHMRDGHWLDIRHDQELIQRVRILQIVVRLETEDIVLRQEWLDEDAADEDYYHRQLITIDSDGIWKVRPSTVHPSEVKPHGTLPPPPEAQSDELQERVASVVLDAAAKHYGIARDALVQESHYLPARQVTMLVVYEMTDLSPHDIATRHFEYKSQTPLISARDKIGWARDAHVTKANVVKLSGRVDGMLAPLRARRTKPFPRDYKRLLGA